MNVNRSKLSVLSSIIWFSLLLNSPGAEPVTRTDGKRMPTPRSEIASAVVEGKIYVVGGVSAAGSLSSFEAYDPETDSWEKLPRLPCELNHVGVAAHRGKIYVSGGFLNLRQTKFSHRLYAYCVESRAWTDVAQLPGKRAKHFMVERDGWLHLIGGLWNTEIWSYRIADGEWRRDRLPPLPGKRDHISVVCDAGSIYIVGGRRDREGELEQCWRCRDRDGGSAWEVFATLPVARGGQTAALHEGRIHVVGGEDLQTGETHGRHDIFDLASRRWLPGEPLSSNRHGMASSVSGGKWVVIGGGRKAGIKTIFSASRTVDVYSLK